MPLMFIGCQRSRAWDAREELGVRKKIETSGGSREVRGIPRARNEHVTSHTFIRDASDASKHLKMKF
jgi:hypothetical protein